MNDISSPYGTLVEPATLHLQRRLSAPVERVWAYLTDSDLRRQWLAAGIMDLAPGTGFEFVWRNDALSETPSQRPEGFPEEHRMQCRILEVDPPHRLVITWGAQSEVTFTLEQQGSGTLLTLLHRRAPDRATLLNVSAGWHAHLDALSARLDGRPIGPFWAAWSSLKQEYDHRHPA
jgi:uncharacterized protein YndB with AHSA1/START domain